MFHFALRSYSRPELEALIEAAIRHLDVLDGDPDAEPDVDSEAAFEHEHEPDETSSQPLTLCPDRVAMCRGRPSRTRSFPAHSRLIRR